MSQSTSYPGAIPPPLGVTADINTPWTHLQYTYIAAFVVAAVIPTIFASLRLYVKAVIVKKWAWADAIFFLSWATFICDLSFCAWNVNHGVYQHAWNITHEQFVKIQGVSNSMRRLCRRDTLYHLGAYCPIHVFDAIKLQKYITQTNLLTRPSISFKSSMS